MLVQARRHRWRVVDTRAFDDCQLITLSGLGPGNAGHEMRLLAPFDAIEPIRESVRPKRVRPVRWRQACRRLLVNAFSDDQLREAARARIDLLPHQLEPAIALVRGLGCRVLLADAVGMGKTIQAGLALAELRARGMADRVLIATPAGLRDQWADELARRFAIEAAVLDVRSIARCVSSLPHGVNPWTTVPVAIASIDYIKRAEVLPAVAACRWDAIVVDEAHGLAGDSDRHQAVAALAARTAYVILLTATPHNGDARGFRALCAIGGEQRPLLVFRHDREALRTLPARRVHRVLLRPSLEERHMHAALADFTRAVRSEHESSDREMWLAVAVLHKRAYSSAQALERTVARRLAAIDPDWHPAEQLELPLESSSEADPLDEAPAWHPALRLRDRGHERHLLTALRAAAVAATARESKLLALGRLLRRIAEPVIVFTEFRDTLRHVAQSIERPAALLHGGLSRQERLDALRAFSSGSRTILLATDAAGEGLNLQQTCRTVINLELPWNPMRLEQRIGRVDRIGQNRRVHAFHLIAAETGEHRLLSSLRVRVARARADIGAPDPLGDQTSLPRGHESEDRVAQLVIAGTPLPRPAFDEASGWRGPEPIAACRDAAIVEAHRLEASRVLTHPARESDNTTGLHARLDHRPLVAVARHPTTRARLAGHALIVWEACLEDGNGRRVCSKPIAMAIALARPLPRSISGGEIEALLTSILPATLAAVRAGEDRPAGLVAVAASFVAARIARERELAVAASPALFQPGLFDRRIHYAHAAAEAARAEDAASGVKRLAELERRASLTVLPPALRLVLLP